MLSINVFQQCSHLDPVLKASLRVTFATLSTLVKLLIFFLFFFLSCLGVSAKPKVGINRIVVFFFWYFFSLVIA